MSIIKPTIRVRYRQQGIQPGSSTKLLQLLVAPAGRNIGTGTAGAIEIQDATGTQLDIIPFADHVKFSANVPIRSDFAINPETDSFSNLGDPADAFAGGAPFRWKSLAVLGILCPINALADGANVTPDLTYRESLIVKASGAAWTLKNPLHAPAANSGQRWSLMIQNASGGVLAAPTLDTLYKSPALTMPANGFSRTFDFRWDGAHHVLVGMLTVDVPN